MGEGDIDSRETRPDKKVRATGDQRQDHGVDYRRNTDNVQDDAWNLVPREMEG